MGVIAIDGTKVRGNASHRRNRDYKQLVGEILAEAERVDREEGEQFGDARGDELPEQLQTAARRRAALKKARQKLERERDEPGKLETNSYGEDQAAPSDGLGLELDAEVIVARTQGHEGGCGRPSVRPMSGERRRRGRVALPT